MTILMNLQQTITVKPQIEIDFHSSETYTDGIHFTKHWTTLDEAERLMKCNFMSPIINYKQLQAAGDAKQFGENV